MCQHNRSFSRALLLLLILVVGPLQTQILYACAEIERAVSMTAHNASDMDTHSTSLCNGHEECISIDCNAAFDSSQSLCCEESSVISINQDLQQNIPILSLMVESDIDPPQATDTTHDIFFFQKHIISAFVVFSSFNLSGQPGSNTYFITRRLRI
jgi:hypothetical protein